MRIRLPLTCTLLAALAAPVAIVLSAAQQQAPADVLVIVDDLQSEFRTTPEIRRFVTRVLEDSRAAGRRVGLVSTREDGASLGPASDPALVTRGVTQITAAGLPRSVLLQGGDATRVERSHRAGLSAERVSVALSAADSRAPEVVFIGPGYERSPDANIARITAAAVSTGAVVHVVDPAALNVDASPTDPRWESLVSETRSTLSALAARTGGLAVFDEATANLMLERLRARVSN